MSKSVLGWFGFWGFFIFIKWTQQRNNLDTLLAVVWKSVLNSYASDSKIQKMKDGYGFSLLTTGASLFVVETLKHP